MTDHSSATLGRVLEAVDRRGEEIVEFAGEFIRQPSVNPDLDPASGGEQRAQRWLRDRLREAGGFEIDEWAAVPTRPNVVARRAGSGGGRSLIWCGHTDVVPVSPEQAAAWSGPGPFSGKVRDGKLWGRGASDMKGAIAAYVLAARMLQDEGVRLRGDLTLAQVCGEESGRKEIGCNSVLERGHRADLAIFPEPSNFAVYPTIKGEIYFTLTVPGKSTHIANRNLVVQSLPHGTERPGVSAIDNMLKYQLALLELERQWLLWRSSPNVPPGGMFVSINSIQAGPMDSPVPTSAVPDSCTATGSLLFYPELTGEEVIAEVRATIDRVTAGDAWLREHPPTLEIPSGHPMKEPVNLPHDHPGVVAIREATRAVTGETPETRTSPFVCDANYWYPLGQPSLVFGPGDPSWGIHGTDEFLPVADLIKAVKVFASVTMTWCEVEE